jgi:O-antigen ligase
MTAQRKRPEFKVETPPPLAGYKNRFFVNPILFLLLCFFISFPPTLASYYERRQTNDDEQTVRLLLLSFLVLAMTNICLVHYSSLFRL